LFRGQLVVVYFWRYSVHSRQRSLTHLHRVACDHVRLREVEQPALDSGRLLLKFEA
jgi:hypothetical protein